jgi:hypothetical protein
MAKLQIKIVNAETGEEVIRDMDTAELAQLEIDRAASQAQAAELATKATEKAALLAKLGITDDEAKLLLS